MSKFIKYLLVSVLVVFIATVVWWNRYNIYDGIVLLNYEAPAKIAQLATDTTMTEKGERLFYVNKPQILGRGLFNEKCQAIEQTIVLGCYNGVSIYVFHVDDQRLDGIQQVTAAHEMLHAAYDRLSGSERKRIDKLTDGLYHKLNNSKLKTSAKNYEEQNPGSIPNELHSILGTEINDIGDELEEYYKQYFNDRSKIVAYAQNYRHVFEDLKAQIAQYDADLSLRKNEINTKENELSSEVATLEAQKASLDALLARDDARAYNAAVPQYNASANIYNAQLADLKNLMSEYNQLVEKRNSIALKHSNLAKSIDSRLSAIPNQ